MIIAQGHNGNAYITLYADGTREVEYPDSGLVLDHPLNVDVRLSEQCQFGLDERTGKSVCDFCHESARTVGRDCDVPALVYRLAQLPRTTEIAIGINKIDDHLIDFLDRMRNLKYIVNGTINQGLVQTGEHNRIIDYLHGIGISFRSLAWNLDDPVYRHPNTVMHVISGIDSFTAVKSLTERVGKILVLGEKDFGFNAGRVDLTTASHREWYRGIHELFGKAVVSFDTLALEQLNIKRFFRDDKWQRFYQGEESIYIDAVAGVYKPSSRSGDSRPWLGSIGEYYTSLC